MKKLLGFLCALILVFGMAGIASALPILESEPNNTLATAQNIDSSFSLGANLDIAYSETIPWVSISTTGDNSYDYYSFTVMGTDVLGIFDIDYGWDLGGSIDTELGLWDSAGNVLVSNDDHWPYTDGAGGSVNGNDAYIAYTFASPGTYIIGVARHYASAHSRGWSHCSDTPDGGDTYTLQVSISGHGTGTAPVPEPSTILLVGTGLIGIIGFGGRKRLNKKA
jgi:hypothetical protein